MDIQTLVPRVEARYLADEVKPEEKAILEALTTVSDRVAIRLGVAEAPEAAASIVVDASVKALRRRGFEGSESESVGEGGSISLSFVSDVLAEYASELDALYKQLHTSGVKFL